MGDEVAQQGRWHQRIDNSICTDLQSIYTLAKKSEKKIRIADTVDKHLLYQESVQNVDFELTFIRNTYSELRGHAPHSMREDFCGTALASAHWVNQDERNTAVAVDIDPDVLSWGRDNNASTLPTQARERLELIEGNVLDVCNNPVDFIQAFNFSYWCFMDRSTMLEYFSRCRAGLKKDGILFLDAYGGFEAYQVQKEKRKVGDYTFVWEQAEFNSVTYEQKCAIHFKFKDGSKLKNAFTYEWRIWGARELREILEEAGFKNVSLYRQAFDEETDEPLDEYVPGDDAGDFACWLGYVVAER